MTQTLADYAETNRLKILNIGESMSGKTGALVSLVKAGYLLSILDYDNGVEILANLLRREAPELLKTVRVESLRDKIAPQGNTFVWKPPMTAWAGAGKALSAWEAERPWSERDVLVLDTLNTASNAAFNQACMLGGRLNQRPQLQDFGWMADSVMQFIQMICAKDFPAHVIVNTHIRYIAGEETTTTDDKGNVKPAGAIRGLPDAKGQEITRSVAIYFNNVVLTRTIGTGPGAQRKITTNPTGVIELGCSNPGGVSADYPLATGMADLFKALLGRDGPGLGA